MALWLVRTGRCGEHMQRFLDTNRIYATWDGLDRDLSKAATRKELYDHLDEGLRAELPLKRIWTVAMPEEAE
jgi:restriction system protein